MTIFSQRHPGKDQKWHSALQSRSNSTSTRLRLSDLLQARQILRVELNVALASPLDPQRLWEPEQPIFAAAFTACDFGMVDTFLFEWRLVLLVVVHGLQVGDDADEYGDCVARQ